MTNLNDTATPTSAFLGDRFAPWKIFCSVLDEGSDEEADSGSAGAGDDKGFDAEDPRDLRVLDRLAQLEAFSAA